MSESARAYKIGLFVLAGIALLVLALLAFGLRGRLEPEFHFETYVVGDAEGLAIGSVVKLRGVAVGRVTGIEFSWNKYPPGDPNCIVISFDVRQRIAPHGGADPMEAMKTAIEQGMRAIVKENEITSTSILSLEFMDPLASPPLVFSWQPRSVYVPSAPSKFGQMVNSFTRVLTNLEKIDFEGIGKNANGLLSAAQSKIDGLDTVALSRNGNAALRDLRHGIGELDALAKSTRSQIDHLQLDRLSKDTDQLITGLIGDGDRLQLTLGQLSQIDVQGLNATISESRTAVTGLSDVLSEIKRQPAQLFFGEAPRPVSAIEKENP